MQRASPAAATEPQHYRAGEMALLAAGATVYDETGVVLPAGEEPVEAHPAGRTR
jgi:hypothetical protein